MLHLIESSIFPIFAKHHIQKLRITWKEGFPMRNRMSSPVLPLAVLSGYILSGCAGGLGSSGTQTRETQNSQGEPTAVNGPDTLDVETGPVHYGIPEEAADVANPVESNQASLERGMKVFLTICSQCHGEKGRADGPMAAVQNPGPHDFLDPEVSALTDGELFYIISSGVEGSSMRSFAYFEEPDRWHMVNFIRSLQE